jgi:hypothetical protein
MNDRHKRTLLVAVVAVMALAAAVPAAARGVDRAADQRGCERVHDRHGVLAEFPRRRRRAIPAVRLAPLRR